MTVAFSLLPVADGPHSSADAILHPVPQAVKR